MTALSVDQLSIGSLDHGKLEKAIAGDQALNAAIAKQLRNGAWFAQQFPAVIDDFSTVRSPGAHRQAVDREAASRWRDSLIGVGCVGGLVALARTRLL